MRLEWAKLLKRVFSLDLELEQISWRMRQPA